MTASLMVQAEGVRKRYGHFDALRGSTWRWPQARCAASSGRPGSGKSTFLRCINHLEKVDAGRLSVDGELVGYREHGGRLYELRDKEVCAKRAQIGMVFQRFNLFPHMTALANVMMAPLVVKGESKAAVEPRARALLDRVGLASQAGRLSQPAVRRPAAAGRHRPGAGHAAQADAVRRAHLGPGSGAGR